MSDSFLIIASISHLFSQNNTTDEETRMKIIFILIVLAIIFPIQAEEIGAFSIGIDNYLGSNSLYDEINPSSPAFGAIVPIRFPNVPTHLKIKIAMHDVDNSKYNDPNATFLHVVNEILVGYRIPRRNKVILLPQIGIGASGERYKIEKGLAGAHVDIFIDLSFRIEYELTKFNIGAMLNFERDLNLGHGSFLSENRLNAALIISK